MVVSNVEAKEIRKAIAQLKEDLTELESRLQQDHIVKNQGSLKSIGIRVLVSAERIEDILSTGSEREVRR